ncbi:WG repeat-containing protein [Isachenkonia alkalipeptolytica]|uniref:WG repeat-containing protein n=1 Tax=Isachenkonia alkalipeptolytica TaxID=2565777 RepID=A0AA43XK79_9CLOT|nr:WG repeat-containing protein [Isachenkonia alkalipeptolytica]NBG87714.1 WG repeat-containing protein [Isachenkonia alkalipeptolytica]
MLIIPLALLLVVAVVIMNSRDSLENQEREELHGVMEIHLEEMLEENRVISWDEEMNSLEILELSQVEEVEEETLEAQVHLGIIDLPKLLEKYVEGILEENLLGDEEKQYEALYQELLERRLNMAPRTFEVTARFQQDSEGKWVLQNEEDFLLTMPAESPAKIFSSGLGRIAEYPVSEEDLESLKQESEAMKELVTLYLDRFLSEEYLVEVTEENDRHRFGISLEHYDTHRMMEDIEDALIEHYGSMENRKEKKAEALEMMEEMLLDEAYREDRETTYLGNFIVTEGTLGSLRITQDFNPREKPFLVNAGKDYLQFFEYPEYIPEFFSQRFQGFHLEESGEFITITGEQEEEESAITIQADGPAYLSFLHWSLEDEVLEGEKRDLEGSRLGDLQSRFQVDLQGIHHREQFSLNLFPVSDPDMEKFGVINEDGGVFIDPVEDIFGTFEEHLYRGSRINLPYPTNISLPSDATLNGEDIEDREHVRLLLHTDGELYLGEEAEQVLADRRRDNAGEVGGDDEPYYTLQAFEEDGVYGLRRVEQTAHEEIPGEVLLEPRYDQIQPGEVAFLEKDGLFGLFHYSEENTWLVEPKFDEISADWIQKHYRHQAYGVADRYIAVKKDGQWGALDGDTGEVTTEYIFDDAGELGNMLRINSQDDDVAQGRMTKNGETGLYDFGNNRWIVEPGEEEEDIPYLFDDRRRMEKNGTYGYKDENHEWVIDPVYEYAQEFRYGLATVSTETEHHILNPEGEVIFRWEKSIADPPRIHYFPEEEIYRGDLWLYFTKEGEVIYSGLDME